MGFSITGILDPALKNVVSEPKAIEGIEKNFFDIIIYGHIHRCLDLWEIVVANYPPNRIVCIDGEDWSLTCLPLEIQKLLIKKNVGKFVRRRFTSEKKLNIIAKRKEIISKCVSSSIMFKRELDVGFLPNVRPISFAIPKIKIVNKIPPKSRRLAFIRPGELDTYIYKTERDYYKGYQESEWGLTFKKGGWDCLRHYEILANGCITYFPDIKDCPDTIMTNFPKQIVNYTNLIYEYNIAGWEYNYYANVLLEYTRAYLTTEKLAEYVLSTIL